MTAIIRHVLLLSIATAISGLSLNVAAQAMNLNARVTNDRVFVGEKLYYNLEVTTQSNDKIPEPQLPDFSPFKVIAKAPPSEMTSTVMVNTHIQHSRSLTYSIRLEAPLEAGLYTIPAATAGSARSVPVRVRVVEDSREFPDIVVQEGLPLPYTSPERQEYDRILAGQLFMRPVLNKTEYYVREPIPIKWEYYSKAALASSNLPDPDFRGPSNEALKNFYTVQGKFPIRSSDVTLGDDQYTKYDISAFVFFPIKEGTIRVPGISANYQLAQRGGGLLRRAFFNLIVPSKMPEVRVKALPTKGRPNDFAGAVGQFSFYVESDSTEVMQGNQVITLTARLKGRGYMDAVPPPPTLNSADFTIVQDWQRQSESTIVKSPGVVEGEAVWTMLIRAARAGDREIPEISYPYFDPYTEQYERAPSHAIPLKVEPWAEYELLRAEQAAADAADPTNEAAEDEQEDFSYLAETAWAERQFLPEGHRPRWQGWVLLGLTALWGLSFVAKAPSRGDRHARAAHAKIKWARQQLLWLSKAPEGTRGSTAQENMTKLNSALRNYLGVKMERSPDGITPEMAQAWIETETGSAPLAAEAGNLLEETGAAAYSPVSLNVQVSAEKALQLIDEIERGKA